MMCAPMADVETRGAAKPSGERRVMHILGAVLVAVVLPAGLIGALVGELGVSAMLVGLLLGASGSKIGGTRRMLYVAPLIGVAAGLGAYTAYDWWWVALLASVGVLAGAGIRFGWLPALLMVPFAATFVTPVSTVKDAAIYGVIVAIAAAYGIVVARRFGAPEVFDGDRLEPPLATVVAIVFGVVLGASAAIGVALGWTEPYWVAEPVLILLLSSSWADGSGYAKRRSAQRSGSPPRSLWPSSPRPRAYSRQSAPARSCSRSRRETYWIMYGLYTFSLVLLLAAPVAERRPWGLRILAPSTDSPAKARSCA
jgi:hypothetical protein